MSSENHHEPSVTKEGVGGVTILLPESLDRKVTKKKSSDTSSGNMMSPDEEPPESHTNGMTSGVKPPGSALRSRGRQKKAPELTAIERRNWHIHMLYVQKRYEECKKIIKEQLDDTRGMCEYANYVQGLILRNEGKIQESFDLFQLCNILNPSSIENIKQMARSLFLLGRHKLAIEAYTQAEAKTEKPDWEIYHNMGICFLHLKDFQGAKEQLTCALDHNKHHMTYSTLAKIYHIENDLTSAISTFRTATEYFPENADLHTSLGLLYMQIGKFQQAFEHLGTALTFDPQNSKAILAAGSMMQSHQDYDVALSKYRIAALKVPESPALWNNIAMCFFGKKKYVASISCLKRANYLAPFDWKILYNLGLVHLTMQQYASAFHFLSAAVNLRPNKGHIFMLLAVTLTYLDDEENAKQAYEQAIKLEEKDPNICLNFAIFLHNKGHQTAAQDLYNQFEMRLINFRQSTGSDLDHESLEAGARLGSTLGIDSHILSQKSKSRLHATIGPNLNDGPTSAPKYIEDVIKSSDNSYEDNAKNMENTAIPVIATAPTPIPDLNEIPTYYDSENIEIDNEHETINNNQVTKSNDVIDSNVDLSNEGIESNVVENQTNVSSENIESNVVEDETNVSSEDIESNVVENETNVSNEDIESNVVEDETNVSNENKGLSALGRRFLI